MLLLNRIADRGSALREGGGHETGPLGEGDVTGTGWDAWVVGPWHGGTFRPRRTSR
ncbi:hypothetical protein L3i22_062480 [Actinoplanes sp. L3-i22]|nr:hypothetical protein L3i22_062480 [Actinoplanes sp. L3-i22]